MFKVSAIAFGGTRCVCASVVRPIGTEFEKTTAATEFLCSFSQRLLNLRISRRMSRIRNDDVLSFGPGQSQVAGVSNRVSHVVFTVNNHTRDVVFSDGLHVFEQLRISRKKTRR